MKGQRIYFVTVQHLKAVFQILPFADLDQTLTDPVDTFLQGIILHDTVFSFQLHRRLPAHLYFLFLTDQPRFCRRRHPQAAAEYKDYC